MPVHSKLHNRTKDDVERSKGTETADVGLLQGL